MELNKKKTTTNIISTFLIYAWIVFATFFLVIIGFILLVYDATGNRTFKIAKVWAKSILTVSRIKVNLEGAFNIDPSRGYIFMPNYQSYFDILILLAHFPVQWRWRSKAEWGKNPIKIGGTEENFESFKSGEVSVMIFPEGARSRNGKIRPFKKGGFALAIAIGSPIVPIIIKGTRSIVSNNNKRINPANIHVEIQKPIDTSAYTVATKDDLVQRVRNIICESFYKK